MCRLRGFEAWFDENEMCELHFTGPKYTWTNKRILERLDRAVCNTLWRRVFAEAYVRHLPRTKSDHSPIKICLQSSIQYTPYLRPFQFEAMWLTHAEFNQFVSENWLGFSGSASDKSYAFVEPLKLWNKDVFGHLRQKKARVLARLSGIQRALCKGPNSFLSTLEVQLHDEFNSILDQEALFWHQKSRLKWLQEGDRNTKFFHLTTIIRQRKNRIEWLKDDEGV